MTKRRIGVTAPESGTVSGGEPGPVRSQLRAREGAMAFAAPSEPPCPWASRLRRLTKRAATRLALPAILVAGAAFPAGVAHAQGRPDSLKMTCAQARSIVATRGAVVIGTGPYIYDRFVADRRFCSLNEFARPAFIRSRDTPQCMVGYKCTPISDGWWW